MILSNVLVKWSQFSLIMLYMLYSLKIFRLFKNINPFIILIFSYFVLVVTARFELMNVQNANATPLSSLIVVNTSRPISLITNEVIKGVLNSQTITQPYEIVFHDYQFKPSDYKLLKSSNIIFAISKDVEKFLDESFKDKDIVYLIDYLDKEDIKEIRSFTHIQNSSIDVGNNSRDTDDIEMNIVDGIKSIEDEQSERIIHDHGTIDNHIWLSIKNAKRISETICMKMAELDKRNSDRYYENTKNFHKKLDQFLEENKTFTSNFQNISYMVMHDSYQYFEDNFNIKAPMGCFIDSSHNFVGSKTFMSYVNAIKNKQYSCIISDNMLYESTQIFRSLSKDFTIQYVDIIGACDMNQHDGDGYMLILNNVLKAFKKCANIES